jgi:hypothetical protein
MHETSIIIIEANMVHALGLLSEQYLLQPVAPSPSRPAPVGVCGVVHCWHTAVPPAEKVPLPHREHAWFCAASSNP